MSSFAHNSQDLVDSSGQPTTSRNDQDFIPGSTGTCVHVSGMSQTLLGHPGSTDTTVRAVSSFAHNSQDLVDSSGQPRTLFLVAQAHVSMCLGCAACPRHSRDILVAQTLLFGQCPALPTIVRTWWTVPDSLQHPGIVLFLSDTCRQSWTNLRFTA